MPVKPKDPLDRGLPANITAEKVLLGAILLNNAHLDTALTSICAADFSLEKHRRIFSRMCELHERNERVDHITVSDELHKHGQLEAVDGIAYLVSLDNALPDVASIDSYVRIVKEKANLRDLMRSAQLVLEQCSTGAAAAQDIAAALSDRVASIQSGQTQDDGRSPEKIVTDYGGPPVFLDPWQRRRGLPTGFTRFDELTGGGLHDGELVILGARPSMGKSSLMRDIARSVCMNTKSPKPVTIFSLEMTAESVLTALLCAEAKIDHHKFRSGFLNKQERGKLRDDLERVMQAPLTIFDNTANMSTIVNESRKAVRNGAALVCVDYLGLIGTRMRGERRDLEIAALTREFKLLAKELHIPILLLSQLSRLSDRRTGSKEPILSDLRDGGSSEQDADVVLFIHRPEVYDRDREELRGQARLIVSKQREGPTGLVNLRFLHHLASFDNDAGDVPEEPPAQERYYDPTAGDNGW